MAHCCLEPTEGLKGRCNHGLISTRLTPQHSRGVFKYWLSGRCPRTRPETEAAREPEPSTEAALESEPAPESATEAALEQEPGPEPEPTFLEGLVAPGLLLQGHVRVDIRHLLLVLHDLLRLQITEHSVCMKGLFTER